MRIGDFVTRLLWISFLFLSFGIVSASCAPGKIYLTSDSDGDSASDSSGGTVGDSSSGQGGDHAPEEPTEQPDRPAMSGDGDGDGPPDFDVPCIIRGDCPLPCGPNQCSQCTMNAGCSHPFPYCESGACVECASDEDCRRRFGSNFDACDFGRCVECERDDDCFPGEVCTIGWCSECKRNYDCDPGEICVDLKCIPEFKNYGPGGRGGG